VGSVDLLVVDDDTDVSATLREILEVEGFTVRVADDGQQGLDQLLVRYPDLVLLDVEMPVMSGPQMAYRMFLDDLGREQIPIVLLTGVPDVQTVAATVGTPYYLQKPYSLEQLLSLLGRALTERRPPDRSHLRHASP
jgi:DNA-binding response OmpR family regulator